MGLDWEDIKKKILKSTTHPSLVWLMMLYRMGLSTHFLQFDAPAFFLLVQNPKSTILQKKLLQNTFSIAIKNWVLSSSQDFL